ncbi:DUF167 domain-containing protein [Bacteriovorax sp. BSW11_IV]|uniref:DUF167 domain-containing protein n=1 Tax=Bacteriovorax sp. BSW11_IV TaxID=1353529 RepID=UPI0018CB12D6|nr:DUF167 domain-containing protein [Bacteriovorax sp. BSW11_IV]
MERAFLLAGHPEQIISFLTDKNLTIVNPKVEGNSLIMGIDLWAKPGSKKEKIVIGEQGELIVYISERPVEGKANVAITKYVARSLGVSPSSFVLDGGARSKFKRFKLIYTFTDHKNVDYYLEKLKKLFL